MADDKDVKIEKIGKVDKTATKNSIEEVADEPIRQPPNKEHFDKLVSAEQGDKAKAEKLDPVQKGELSNNTSIMDEMRDINRKVDKIGKVSPKDLVAQADKVVAQIEGIKKKLATPDLAIHPSTQVLLQNKLAHIDENLRTALSKAGLEYNPSASLDDKTVNPVERFLGFLTHGQAQMAHMSTEINNMALNNKEISPANMLRIQMKMGYITQEIQFFAAVLNKALDSTKTIMNIQV